VTEKWRTAQLDLDTGATSFHPANVLFEKRLFNPVIQQTEQTITLKRINLCLLSQIRMTYMFRLLFGYLQGKKT
jgi:hypothetical protein